MNNTLPYDTTRVITGAQIYTNYGSPMINPIQNYNMAFATNDPSALCLSGNAYTIKLKGDEVARQGPGRQIKSLRISLTGTVMHAFNLCCWIVTIILGSIFLFPLFFICCDWWKRQTFQTFNVDNAGYQGIAELIQYSGAQEIYLTVQDSYFNSTKAHILTEAISRSRIQNISFSNCVAGFNAIGDNYSTFDMYMRPMKQYVKFAEISWGRKFVI